MGGDLRSDIQEQLSTYLDSQYVSNNYLASHPPATREDLASIPGALTRAPLALQQQQAALQAELLQREGAAERALATHQPALDHYRSVVNWYCNVYTNMQDVENVVASCQQYSDSQTSCEKHTPMCSWNGKSCVPTQLCNETSCLLHTPTYMRGDLSGDSVGGTLVARTAAGGTLRMPIDRAVSTSGEITVGVRPEKLMLAAEAPTTDDNVLGPGRITDLSFTGVSTQYTVEMPGIGPVGVFEQNMVFGSVFSVGSEVWVRWRPEHTFGLDADAQAGAAEAIADSEDS